jgi:PAS domain S-box-containing protein
MTGSDASSPQEDLEHYRILSETAFDYAFKTRIGPGGVPIVEWMSENWTRDFGYEVESPTELFGGVHPDDLERAAEQWTELLTGRSIEGDIRLLPRSGGLLWVHHRTRPIIDPDSGRVVGTYGTMQDINERKLAEEQWQQAEARLRVQYQSSPITTCTWQHVGEDYVLIDFNHAAEDLTKGRISKYLGLSAREMFADRPEDIADLVSVFETGEPVKKELTYRIPGDAGEKDLYVIIAKVAPNLAIVHALDLTEQRHAEAEREELRARLKAAKG